jgi:hypothetical protein
VDRYSLVKTTVRGWLPPVGLSGAQVRTGALSISAGRPTSKVF